MKLSKHFNRSEFSCKCGCGFDTVDAQLLDYLESIRVYFNKPVEVNSSCSCAAHNKNLGGKPNSQHLYGRAADIVVKDVTPQEVAEFARGLIEFGGVGEYRTFTHIDSR